jgi:hypothetical protein
MQQPVDKQPEHRYKFLHLQDGEIRSIKGNCSWTLGEWKTERGIQWLCHHGFHCSVQLTDAFFWGHSSIAVRVEVAGRSDIDNRKEAWESMRIVNMWQWTPEDCLALALFAASLVLPVFEQYAPDDPRPRKAVEAAEAYLRCRTEQHALATGEASYRAKIAYHGLSYYRPGQAGKAAHLAAYIAGYLPNLDFPQASEVYRKASHAISAALSAEELGKEQALSKKINTWMMERLLQNEPFLPSGTQNDVLL